MIYRLLTRAIQKRGKKWLVTVADPEQVEKLSAGAFQLLHWMLCHGPGWIFRRKDMASALKTSERSISRRMAELVAGQYLERYRHYADGAWMHTYFIFPIPKPEYVQLMGGQAMLQRMTEPAIMKILPFPKGRKRRAQ